MASLILLHLLYLLTSIIGFNKIQDLYIVLVQINLILFMGKIREMLLKSWHYLHDLMNKLIKKFCVMINIVFIRIKAKLLYYLKLVELQIYVDILDLTNDIESFNEMLSKLKSEVDKYISILDAIDGLLNALTELMKDNTEFRRRISSIIGNNTIKKVHHIFSHQNKKISEILKDLSSIHLEKSIELTPDNVELVMNLKMGLGNLQEQSKDVIRMSIDNSFVFKFNKSAESIKNIFDIIDTADIVVTEEIIAIIRRLELLEIINLGKLYKLMADIEIKYFEILFRVYLLICTVIFYTEVGVNVLELFKLMNFDCCNASEFLSSCSKVENYIRSTSNQIDRCIIKLRKAFHNSKCLGVQMELLNLYSKIIEIIRWLKFYVDLMAIEILIFKMIILTLIEMTVSSVLIKLIEDEIGKITDIEDAIPTLIVADNYLRAFYFIQLENTMVIFGLSSKLMFSQYIHGYYDVLIINLYWINLLIWVIECYINHLIVFKYASVFLNSLKTDIGGLGNIIDQIKNVAISTTKIIDKLNLIKSSMNTLNDIQESMDITNFKESAAKIRDQTESISRETGEINSQITKISGFVRSILSSWAKLVSIYYFLFGLISQVHNYILKNNDPKVLRTGILSRYLNVDILSVMEPCNKQLILILAYLIDMWSYIGNLNKIVEGTIVVIYAKMGWLYGLTSKLQTNIDEINKGVVNVECAIDGVVINFIRCTLQSTNNSIVRVTSLPIDNRVVSMYSLSNVTDYKVLVNRMLEFWTFSDESVELFKYIRFCLCALSFETKHRDQRPSTFLHSLPCIKTCDVNPVSEFGRKTMAENVGNHLCLCLVIKYHLRPSLLKCILILRNEELGTLDTLSRKYDNYNSWLGLHRDLWKLCGLVLNIIYELTSLLRNRYLICSCNDPMCKCVTQYKSTSGSSVFPNLSLNPTPDQIDSISYVLHKLFTFLANVAHDITYPLHQGIIANLSRCFCMYSNDPYYSYLISVILFVSSLIENICTMDPETLRMSIEKLSVLYSQLEIYDFKSIEDSKVCCNPVYSLLVNKKCQPKAANKCCWCVTCYNLGIILIYLCNQFRLFNALCKNAKELCNNWKEFCTVEECKCQQQGNGSCCLLKLVISSALPCDEELQEALEKCNGGQCECCKKLKEKLKDVFCKVLLLGCECNCTTAGTASEVKTWCVFFNNPWGSSSVAVVVFCKCKDEQKGCCLTAVIEKLKDKVDNICQDTECVCDELKNVCDDICGTECGTECVCPKLKEKLTAICNGDNTGECLWKQIDKTIGKCFKDGGCTCKNKGCCKILGSSVRLLVRACRANVLEPYNRIVTDLITGSKDKKEPTKSILDRINDSMVKKISLCKNYNTNVSINGDLKDVKSVRNWGCDTHYEHHVTTNSFSQEYPNIACNRTGYRNGISVKMFKMNDIKLNIL